MFPKHEPEVQAAKDIENAPKIAEHLAKLPEVCFGTLNSTGELIILKAGEKGYWPASGYALGGFPTWDELADFLNNRRGASKAQRAAMEAGSMFGFHVPLADVDQYDDDGKLR